MRLMVTGGGTAGHTSPALAVIEELQSRDSRLAVQWIGRGGAVEEQVCLSHDLPFRRVPMAGWPRRGLIRRGIVAGRLAVSVLLAGMYIRRFRPQVVFGVGGYVSVPVMWAAQRAGIPTVMHEQNRTLGMANRLLAQRADRILLSFPDTKGEFPRDRATVTGNPVRAAFQEAPDAVAARRQLDLDIEKPVVVVTGGSQGAQTLNRAMEGLLANMRDRDVQFIWLAGKQGAAQARSIASVSGAVVQVHAFVEDMATVCAAADLIVSRAGASSTAEIAALGKPSILIPYPHATDNHQEQNARAFEEVGAAVMLLDGACTPDALTQAVQSLLSNPERLRSMGAAATKLARPGATDAIVEEILSVVFGHSGGAIPATN